MSFANTQPKGGDWDGWTAVAEGDAGNGISNGKHLFLGEKTEVEIRRVGDDEGNDCLEVTFYRGEVDGKPVIQVDGSGDFRINVNDGTVFDRHTESNSIIYQAALRMYQLDAGYGASPLAHHTLPELHELRRELLDAGFDPAMVDGDNPLPPIACIVCDKEVPLSDAGLCTDCEAQEQGAPA